MASHVQNEPVKSVHAYRVLCTKWRLSNALPSGDWRTEYRFIGAKSIASLKVMDVRLLPGVPLTGTWVTENWI